MPALEIVVGDLLAQPVDAIVNPANEHLVHGGGVARLIASRAGVAWEERSRRLAPLPVGSAAIDDAGDLPVRHVIHAVGPRWRGGADGEPEELASVHRAVVRVARDSGVRSLALPAISTGIFGYPPERAAPVAMAALGEALRDGAELNVLVCLIDPAMADLYAEAIPGG